MLCLPEAKIDRSSVVTLCGDRRCGRDDSAVVGHVAGPALVLSGWSATEHTIPECQNCEPWLKKGPDVKSDTFQGLA